VYTAVPCKRLVHGRVHGLYAAVYIGVNFVIKVGGLVARAEREPITGVWGPSPQRGP